MFDEFVELHGDRAYGDDRAIITGFAKLDEFKVMLVGQHKGRNLKERNECYYGCAHPEGYRKALEKMRMAAKFGMPIICLIDTLGAYPGIGAEERGQAYTIALNLREMSQLKTPIVCVVIGEGGSGGALGIGIGDHVAVMQFAYYSVISPEGCAGILWKHVKHADAAARALRFTSKDLLKFGVVDEVIPEPLGGAHRDHRGTAATLKALAHESAPAAHEPSARDAARSPLREVPPHGRLRRASRRSRDGPRDASRAGLPRRRERVRQRLAEEVRVTRRRRELGRRCEASGRLDRRMNRRAR